MKKEDIIWTKEIDTTEFRYFVVVKGIIAAGVFDEDDDNVYFVVLKSVHPSYTCGKVGRIPKKLLQKQIEEGTADVLQDLQEAEQYAFESKDENN